MGEGSIIWSSIYLTAGMVSLGLSVNILLRQRHSSIHQLFFIYGLATSLHLVINFFKLIAPNPDLSLKLFRISNSLYFVSIGLLTYLVYGFIANGEKQRGYHLHLILIPSVFVVTISSFISYEAKLSDFGWMFIPKPPITIEGIITFLYMLSYSAFIGIILYNCIKNAKVPWLRRKYSVMFLSFTLFQIIGVMLFNALLIAFENIPPTSGPFYFLSFILLSYSFTIGPPKEVVLTRMGNPLTDSYQKFLNKLIDVAPPDELGLKTMDLLEYLDRTRLSDVVTYDRLRIILNAEKIESLNSIQALDKTLEYFESRDWAHRAADELTEVLESMYFNLGSPEDREAFKTVIMNHQEYLKKTDIVYGLASGEFLALISPDASLEGLPEWEVVLRLYKRLLLPVRKLIAGPLASEFFKRMRSMDVTKQLDVSLEGKIGIDRVVAYVRTIPNGRRLETVMETFNALLSTVLSYMASEDASLFESYLGVMRRVFMLNCGAKGVWKTYYSLTNRLTLEFGRQRITKLVHMEDSSVEDLNAFSGAFGLTHDRLLRRKILFEYNPKYIYETYVAKAVREIYANTERCILLLRPASGVLSQIPTVENVKLIPVVTMGAKPGESVSFDDVTQMINAINRSLDSEMHTWIILDISDMILSTSMEQAYAFARHAIELVSAKNGSAIFMLNEPAHDLSVKTAFEGLFSTILQVAEKPRLLKLV